MRCTCPQSTFVTFVACSQELKAGFKKILELLTQKASPVFECLSITFVVVLFVCMLILPNILTCLDLNLKFLKKWLHKGKTRSWCDLSVDNSENPRCYVLQESAPAGARGYNPVQTGARAQLAAGCRGARDPFLHWSGISFLHWSAISRILVTSRADRSWGEEGSAWDWVFKEPIN